MNKSLILCALAAVAAFPQAQTPLTITQSAGSATGELRMQERRTNGTDYVGIKAPQSIAASLTYILPGADGSSGQCLQTDGAGQWQWAACTNTRLVSDYNWTQVVGARSGSGALTLTFTGTSCPAAGADTAYKYRLYETSTPTTYELATSNGTGTCTRGGAGTIVATGPTGTYTNATATSASSGWQEAVFSVADSLPVHLRAAVGGYYVYSDILTEDRYLTAECDGPGALLVPMANNVAVFNAASPGGIRVSHCGFNNAYAKTGTKAIRTYNPDGNSFGSLIYDNNISGFSTCVDLQTVYGITAYSYNRHIDCADTALFLSNIETGDAGIGLIGPGNIFSDSVTANYGIHWNGPGNLKVVGNSFNGYIEQIRLAPKMGVVNVVGTAVTRVSGPEFRASMVGGGFVASSTVAATVASVTDGTNLVLVSNAVTCTGCIYYVGNTGQMQIVGNTLDSWTWTTHNIRAVSDLPFYNFQFDGNFFSNPNTSTYAAGVSVEGAGFYFGSVKHNNLQTSYTVAEAAISLSGGNYIDVANNQIVNHLTGVAIGASGVGHTVSNNHCTNNATTTNCVTSAASGTVITQVDSVTYTQLAALSAANSSSLYCSNCKQTSASSATCATGGSGARATRINGAWKCEDGSAVSAYVQGGNSFGATAELGTNDTYGLSIKTDGVGRWSIPATGHLYAGANNTYDIGAGLSANSPRSIYAVTSIVTPKIGRDSSASFTIMTDSADRWIYTSAGMLTPATTDTYDIGNLTTPLRVRGVYSKIVDTSLAGGTGDYMQTRKLQLFDNTGSSTGASYWDLNVVMSGVGAGQNSYFYLRDNGGNTVWRADKISSGSPVATTTIYTDLLPDSTANVRDLGKTTQRWGEINGASLDLSGAANITGNLSAAIINATGSPAYRVSGTTVINASREATFTGLTIATGAVNGYVWTSDASGVGSWQALASGLPVTDTTGIAKGSSDATKIVRLEVDGFTTATTRVLTPPNANATIAGLEVQQSFTAPQTVAIASVQNQMTLTQTNPSGTYDPACLVLASSDTVTSNTYGAARLCAGYESASFTNEKVAIQTATGYGTYQDVLTFKNQVATFEGDITATVGSFSFSSGTMAGTMKPLFNSTGKIGDTSYYYGNGYFTTANIGTVEGATAYKMSGTTVINASQDAFFASERISANASPPTAITSTLSQIVGADATTATLSIDSFGAIARFNTRRAEGTGASPSAVASGVAMMQIGAFGYGTSAYSTTAKVGITAFSTQAWTNTANGTRLVLFTTPNDSATERIAWQVGQDASFTPGTHNAFTIGLTGTRPSNIYSVLGDFSGLVTASAGLTVSGGSSLLMDRATRATNQQAYWTVAGNPSTTGAWAIGTVPNGAASEFRVTHNGTAVITSGEGGQVDFAGVVTTGGALTVTGAATANRFNATNTNPFQVSGTTVIDSSRNASFVGLTLNGSITGDLIPATSAVYVIGSSSFLWNNIHADVVTVYTSLIPDASASANLGGSTKRWTKTWTADLDITGTITPPSGTAFSGTKTVRASGGASDCTLTFSAGIMTGGTC